jgi:AraC family transcriptional regulator, regulatory protein of adaptative response / methylated-DNA-[protein]-cysteine methyltransferase
MACLPRDDYLYPQELTDAMKKTEPQPHLTDDARWKAVLSRDASADGAFYYAVHPTGIYCRPTCPARRPLRAQVAFFEDIDSAERAHFRPCLRCRPTEVSPQQRVVAYVLQYLDTAEVPPSLAELGEAAGLSSSHLRRVFKRATGLSPKQYAAAQRLERFKAGLKQGRSVTGAMYGAGYGSSRGLYEKASQQLGMAPRAYKRGGEGEQIAYMLTDSPLGRMLVAATGVGLCAVYFGEDAALLQDLRAEYPRATFVWDREILRTSVDAILNHLRRSRPRRLDLSIDVEATAFQVRVWEALRAIPYGQTRSYAEIAAAIGEPRAVRAVARACAANPVALVVPCHRVVKSNGEMSGYRWGVKRRRVLMQHERRQAETRTQE